MIKYKNGVFYSQGDQNGADGIEISPEEFRELMLAQMKGFVISEDENGKPVSVVKKYTKNEVLEHIRRVRQYECFSIINRSQIYFDRFNEEQKKEISDWYNEWLDCTELYKDIKDNELTVSEIQLPVRPSFLN